MGHMHRVRQNVHSTQKVTSTMIMDETEEELILEKPQQLINWQHNVSINTIQFEELNRMISTDQTGWFSITSGQGNTQIMVMYDNDTNIINTTAIKSTHKEDLIQGYDKLYNDMKKAGITQVIQRLDNEISQNFLIEAIEEKQLQYQLAPPGNHQTLPAE